MSTRKTKEEKERLIADYKASGLSMGKWCSAHNIAVSTFSGWINKRKKKISKSNCENKFVEVTFSAGQDPVDVADIAIEYQTFRITVPAKADFKTLENVLKAVAQINV